LKVRFEFELHVGTKGQGNELGLVPDLADGDAPCAAVPPDFHQDLADSARFELHEIRAVESDEVADDHQPPLTQTSHAGQIILGGGPVLFAQRPGRVGKKRPQPVRHARPEPGEEVIGAGIARPLLVIGFPGK
jgi:hypothetical protein